MCGIAGILGPEADGDSVRRMCARLHHRGPDDRGTFVEGPVALGHTRLCVLDPSSAGRQPMLTSGGRHVLVYNGEVYNFREMRAALRDRGCQFRSATDTEIVLNAWAEWGPNTLKHLRGMFAFAVWDRREACLHLVRDHLGIKPLYWHYDGTGTLVFASEVRALLVSELLDRALDSAVLPAFLSQQTVPTPRTLVEGVRMLSPGSRLKVEVEGGKAGQPEVLPYCPPLASFKKRREVIGDTSREEDLRGLRERLQVAVEHRLVADVPLGAFLSGGVDSTAVVGLMSRISEEPVRTFTVAFEEAGYDDAPYARLAAEHFGTDHTEIHLSDDELLARIPAAVAAQDHPSGDGINTWIVSRAAQEAGLTVALSGLGGDELFGGYPSFRRLARLARARPVLRALPPPARVAVGRLLRSLRPGVATDKLAALLGTDGSVAGAYPILRQLFEPGQVNSLLAVHSPYGRALKLPYTESLRRAFRRHPSLPLLARVSFAEMTSYMLDVLLRDTDQMSMAHSLEVRVPFLDREVVEYALALPEEARATASPPKRYLVEALRDLLPEPVAERPKSGFAMPFDRWMRGPLRDFCEEGIGAAAVHPAFCEEGVWDVWRGFLGGDRRLPWSRPWLLVALGHWLERNEVETVA